MDIDTLIQLYKSKHQDTKKDLEALDGEEYGSQETAAVLRERGRLYWEFIKKLKELKEELG